MHGGYTDRVMEMQVVTGMSHVLSRLLTMNVQLAIIRIRPSTVVQYQPLLIDRIVRPSVHGNAYPEGQSVRG